MACDGLRAVHLHLLWNCYRASNVGAIPPWLPPSPPEGWGDWHEDTTPTNMNDLDVLYMGVFCYNNKEII